MMLVKITMMLVIIIRMVVIITMIDGGEGQDTVQGVTF